MYISLITVEVLLKGFMYSFFVKVIELFYCEFVLLFYFNKLYQKFAKCDVWYIVTQYLKLLSYFDQYNSQSTIPIAPVTVRPATQAQYCKLRL